MQSTFPTLSSGAVAQYPVAMSTGQNTQVIRFLDGTDQRYLQQGRSFRSWEIQLALLNEAEIAQVEAFFAAQHGDYSTFLFPDPFTGTVIANCRLASPGIVSQYLAENSGATSLWVIETNG